MTYYDDKLGELADIFGVAEVYIKNNHLIVSDNQYPIVDDVIVLLDPKDYTNALKKRLGIVERGGKPSEEIAEDIQFTFGEEWKKFNEILPEHKQEFADYFDLVTDDFVKGKRVCDLGCGIGRWSYFLHKKCRSIVLVDFSDAIFEARKNLSGANNAIFFMADLTKLPFRDDFADFLFSLGVLHHLPINALDAVRTLAKKSPDILIYLYYALDNRPAYFRPLLSIISAIRILLSSVKNDIFRDVVVSILTAFVYVPLIFIGYVLRPIGLSRFIPLYDGYKGKGFGRIRQDVYDRFFTRIEQRVSREEIMSLSDAFAEVKISDGIPYWHFLCHRNFMTKGK